VLAALLWHFDWKLPDGMVPEEMDMAEAIAISAPPRSDLVLVAVPRVPVPIVLGLVPHRKLMAGEHNI
jgi:hypothetical protein